MRVINTPSKTPVDPSEKPKFKGVCTNAACGRVNSDVSTASFFLRVPCASQVLWARNTDELGRIKAIVEQTVHRPENGGHVRGGCRCCAVQGFPTWLLLASNREKVLKAIANLEKKLADAQAEM
jgi:hypothetical protein